MPIEVSPLARRPNVLLFAKSMPIHT